MSPLLGQFAHEHLPAGEEQAHGFPGPQLSNGKGLCQSIIILYDHLRACCRAGTFLDICHCVKINLLFVEDGG